jgi:leucyl aminopeptidase (aminopeptidase T)
MEMKFVELMESARIIVEDCVKLKPGEEALVVTDTRATDYCGVEALLYAIIGALKAIGIEPVVLSYTAKASNGDELPRAVAEAMKNTDAIFALTTRSILHTTAAGEARAAGVKTMMLPAGSGVGFTNDMIYRLMPKSRKEIEDIAELTNRIGSLIKNGRSVKITTKKGTDLTLNVGQLKMVINDGYFNQPGIMQFIPSGMLAIGVDPGSANGKLVSDVSISRVSSPISQPITFMIKDGYVKSIAGGKEAEEFEKIIKSQNDPDAYFICEVGLGMNAKAKPSCDTLENEHIYGGGHIGFGSNDTFGGNVRCANNWHVDTCFLDAAVWIDGKKILEDGVYLV